MSDYLSKRGRPYLEKTNRISRHYQTTPNEPMVGSRDSDYVEAMRHIAQYVGASDYRQGTTNFSTSYLDRKRKSVLRDAELRRDPGRRRQEAVDDWERRIAASETHRSILAWVDEYERQHGVRFSFVLDTD